MFGFAVKKAIFLSFSFCLEEKKNVDFGIEPLDLKVGECCFGLGIRWWVISAVLLGFWETWR